MTTTILITPPISPDYYIFREEVSEDQAIVGFHKFTTIGIGFQFEDEDWNTNLPYTSDADVIFEHIKHNSRGADPKRCVEAIRTVQQQAIKWMKK